MPNWIAAPTITPSIVKRTIRLGWLSLMGVWKPRKRLFRIQPASASTTFPGSKIASRISPRRFESCPPAADRGNRYAQFSRQRPAMIVVIRPNTPREQIDEVIAEVQKLGYDARSIFGTEQTVVAAIGDERTHVNLQSLSALPQVQQVMPVQKRYKLVSRESHPEDTVVNVDGVRVGGGSFGLMAGPCSVESEEQLMKTAHAVKAAGATILRGGAFKPRTSPYEFQGLGKDGLRLLALAKKETGLKIITELLSEN